MKSHFYVPQVSSFPNKAFIGAVCLLVALILLTLVLSPLSAAFSGAGAHNAPAGSPLPIIGQAGEDHWFFLPSIHSQVPSQKVIIDQGDIWNVPNDFASATVEAVTIHRWQINLFADEAVGVTAIATFPADIVLSLTQNGQAIIDRQNNSPPGEAEVMITPEIATDEAYEILIETADRSRAEYAVAAYVPGVFEIQFKGFLASGAPQQENYLLFESTDFWFFSADAGDLLTMELTPDENSDIVGELYGPEAEFLEPVDNHFAGEVERLTDYPLLESGLHAIRVFELDNDDPGMTYDIVIDW